MKISKYINLLKTLGCDRKYLQGLGHSFKTPDRASGGEEYRQAFFASTNIIKFILTFTPTKITLDHRGLPELRKRLVNRMANYDAAIFLVDGHFITINRDGDVIDKGLTGFKDNYVRAFESMIQWKPPVKYPVLSALMLELFPNSKFMPSFLDAAERAGLNPVMFNTPEELSAYVSKINKTKIGMRLRLAQPVPGYLMVYPETDTETFKGNNCELLCIPPEGSSEKNTWALINDAVHAFNAELRKCKF